MKQIPIIISQYLVDNSLWHQLKITETEIFITLKSNIPCSIVTKLSKLIDLEIQFRGFEDDEVCLYIYLGE